MERSLSEDLTPPGFELPQPDIKEEIKAHLRPLVYPLWNIFTTVYLRNKFPFLKYVPINKVLYGERGNDYLSHRRRLNRFIPIRGKRVLIEGCGLGRDVPSWLLWQPRLLYCVDLLNYRRAWDKLRAYAETGGYKTMLVFGQVDSMDKQNFADGSFDIVASDALYQHLTNPTKSLEENRRVLRPGGFFYTTIGPLWYSYGGDHFSGRGGLREGFNHLLLKQPQYMEYLNSFPKAQSFLSDGRFYIERGLFSYIKWREFMELLRKKGFRIRYSFVIVSMDALRFQKEYPQLWEKLLEKFEEEDLLIRTLSVICEKGD